MHLIKLTAFMIKMCQVRSGKYMERAPLRSKLITTYFFPDHKINLSKSILN